MKSVLPRYDLHSFKSGLLVKPKINVQTASTANLTLSGGLSIAFISFRWADLIEFTLSWASLSAGSAFLRSLFTSSVLLSISICIFLTSSFALIDASRLFSAVFCSSSIRVNFLLTSVFLISSSAWILTSTFSWRLQLQFLWVSLDQYSSVTFVFVNFPSLLIVHWWNDE